MFSLLVVGVGHLKVDVCGKLSFTRKILNISRLNILSFLFCFQKFISITALSYMHFLVIFSHFLSFIYP